jgi:hypothetical protein
MEQDLIRGVGAERVVGSLRAFDGPGSCVGGSVGNTARIGGPLQMYYYLSRAEEIVL